jgi:hypothetical protein
METITFTYIDFGDFARLLEGTQHLHQSNPRLIPEVIDLGQTSERGMTVIEKLCEEISEDEEDVWVESVEVKRVQVHLGGLTGTEHSHRLKVEWSYA